MPDSPTAKGCTVSIPVSPGELVDKITILEIKSERISDAAKLRNVRHELALLNEIRAGALPDDVELARLTAELKAVNLALWDIEDDIRQCEADADFGPHFVDLARAVYRTNDRRAVLKQRIAERLGSTIVEEKSYRDY